MDWVVRELSVKLQEEGCLLQIAHHDDHRSGWPQRTLRPCQLGLSRPGMVCSNEMNDVSMLRVISSTTIGLPGRLSSDKHTRRCLAPQGLERYCVRGQNTCDACCGTTFGAVLGWMG